MPTPLVLASSALNEAVAPAIWLRPASSSKSTLEPVFCNSPAIALASLAGFFSGASVYFVNRLFASHTQEILVRFILLVFTSLVALFIVDKVVAWQVKLLSEEQNSQLFDLIKTLVLMIFSYYFGTKEGVETNGDKNK